MNKRIKYLQTILVAMAVLICCNSLAQTKQPASQREPVVNKRAQILQEQLGLTPAQSAALEQLHQQFVTGLDSLRKSGVAKEEQKKRFDQLVADQDNGLQSIVTPDQYQKLKQMQAAAHKANVKKLQQQQAHRNAELRSKPVNQ
jgi:hypothetical protein